MDVNPPKDPDRFFPWLKEKSEKYWEDIELEGLYGFQIQNGTKWNPGLTELQIAEYEKQIGFKFPDLYKKFLKQMNGTDQPSINIFGGSGTPYTYASEYYSYPRDLKVVKGYIDWICKSYHLKPDDIDGSRIPFIMPIVSHRFLVIDKAGKNPILSMYGDDVIAYASNLQNFLVDDIFHHHKREEKLPNILVGFWLDTERSEKEERTRNNIDLVG